MPNHVTTRCVVAGKREDIMLFRQKVFCQSIESQGEIIFDFNRIIPMPKVLRSTQAGSSAFFGLKTLKAIQAIEMAASVGEWITEAWVEELRDKLEMHEEPVKAVLIKFLEVNPEYKKYGQMAINAKDETGFENWYEWSLVRWGTKWNSYNVTIINESDNLEFTFETAWSFPTPIFEKLIEMFPSLQFSCSCFDEGWGFAGEGFFGQSNNSFVFLEATPALYETVYGYKYD